MAESNFLVPNPSNFLGDESPQWLAVALNTGGLTFSSNASDVTPITMVRARMVRKILTFGLRLSEGFAFNESLALSLSYVDLQGNAAATTPFTFDNSNTPVGGGEGGEVVTGVEIPPGSIVSLVRDYSAGGQANNPTVQVVVQLY